ncbi:hypothetical protein AVEN_253619-1 [Araneus ventricosus]|uniref:Uncharacterized protein n=1 Tax=Araneus ventricosus TaxID=182803 RepID=A0A4Y2C9X1_ARAVE|nr:hypothetical protein AVEN_253619-1 [Araneus ventricosus]
MSKTDDPWGMLFTTSVRFPPSPDITSKRSSLSLKREEEELYRFFLFTVDILSDEQTSIKVWLRHISHEFNYRVKTQLTFCCD